MNPIHIDALVTATREAIEAAQAPLLKRLDELQRELDLSRSAASAANSAVLDRVGELESRAVPPAYDDSQMRKHIGELAEKAETAVSAVAAWQAPAPYDDQELREMVKSLQQSRAADTEAILQRITTVVPYDDSSLRKQLDEALEEVQGKVPAAYDDSGLSMRITAATDQIEGVKRSVESLREALQAIPPPTVFDDSALRGEIDSLAKSVSEHVETTRLSIASIPPPAIYDDRDIRELLGQMGKSVETLGKDTEALRSAPAPADGRDALDIEILPEVELTRSYPRGTYAKHDGGLWRSYQRTQGLRGWECIVDGVKSITPAIEGKTLSLTVTRSSGEETRSEAVVPLQVYRGVWADGDYLEGDTATWAGSLWHCNRSATKAKPGDGSTDWTLAVKKGRDASAPVKI